MQELRYLRKSLRKIFDKTAVGEDDTMPLFKFTAIMSDILNRGGEMFSVEIDKFAWYFMCQGSKSLVSFSALESFFNEQFQEHIEDEDFEYNKREALLKHISYHLILYEIDIYEKFKETRGWMTVAQFRRFLKDQVEIGTKFEEDELLSFIDGLTGGTEYVEVDDF